MKKTLFFTFLFVATFAGAQTQAIPYTETFESFTAFTAPGNGWQGGFQVYSTHGVSSSKGLIKNLNNFTTKDSTITPKMGVVAASSWLKFDYRIVEFSLYPSTSTILSQGDMLQVSVSANGGAYSPVLTIDQSNHVTSTAFKTDSVDISQFAGDSIRVKFAVKRGTTGDYFVDLDNINVSGGGTLPSSVNEIAANGIKIYPNPAVESFTIYTKNAAGNSIKVELFNMLGQKVFSQLVMPAANGLAIINTNGLAKGLYVVNVLENGHTYTQKLFIAE